LRAIAAQAALVLVATLLISATTVRDARGAGDDAPPPAAAAKSQSAQVLLHFPDDRSMGVLSAYLLNTNVPSRDFDVRGTVLVPRGWQLTLTVGQPACTDLSELHAAVREGVEHLYFNGVQLSEANLDQIVALSGVKSLTLGACNLKDEDLARLARLESLTSLALYGSPMLTDAGIAHLAKLPRLESLDILSTQMSDDSWPVIGKLTALKSLRLGDRTITDAGFVHLRNLTQLEHLMIDGLKTISPRAMAEIGRLTNLNFLNLGRAQYGDAAMAELAGLTRLTLLDLGDSGVSDRGLKHLRGMQSLIGLTLPREITDEGMRIVADLPKLNGLTYDGSGVTHVGIAYLAKVSNLQSLSLSGDEITNQAMHEVARLHKLTVLWLGDCPVGDEGLAALAPLKSLEFLLIDRTEISDEGLRHLAQFPRLTNLTLHDLAGDPNGISCGLKHLQALTQLTSLDVGSLSRGAAPLVDSDLEHVVVLKNLRELDLGSFPVTDAGAERLLELPGLTRLTLDISYVPRLTDHALAFFARMNKLTGLTVGGKFTDRGLEELGHSSSLRTITIASDSLSAPALAELRKRMTVQVLPAPSIPE
jgi:Leucine-rich repeat (LRR) protein